MSDLEKIKESAFIDEIQKLSGLAQITRSEVAANLEAAGIKNFGKRTTSTFPLDLWHSEASVNSALGRTSTPSGRASGGGIIRRTTSPVMGERELRPADVETNKANMAKLMESKKNIPMAKDTTGLGTPDISKYSELAEAAFLDEIEKIAGPINAGEARGAISWIRGLFSSPGATQEVRQAVVGSMRAPGAGVAAAAVAPREMAAARQAGQNVAADINQVGIAAKPNVSPARFIPKPAAASAPAQIKNVITPSGVALAPGQLQSSVIRQQTALVPHQGVGTGPIPSGQPVAAVVAPAEKMSAAGNGAGGFASGAGAAEAASAPGSLVPEPRRDVAITPQVKPQNQSRIIDAEVTDVAAKPVQNRFAGLKTFGAGAALGIGAGAVATSNNQPQYQYRG